MWDVITHQFRNFNLVSMNCCWIKCMDEWWHPISLHMQLLIHALISMPVSRMDEWWHPISLYMQLLIHALISMPVSRMDEWWHPISLHMQLLIHYLISMPVSLISICKMYIFDAFHPYTKFNAGESRLDLIQIVKKWIAAKVCTCHDSCAVVACANFRSDLMFKNHIWKYMNFN